MVFEVLPDGSAAVSGPPVELSPAEIAKIAGQGVTDLGTSHGFKGYFVRSGAHFQVFYATPDGQQLIPGILYDAAGKDVTREQVANVSGAVPTVEVTDGKGATSVSALPLVQKTAFGIVGKETAPRIYMLIDPQCIYSIRALQMLKPFVDAGRVQLAVVPLSVLDYEDNGASTQAALALLSKPADQIVTAWQARDVTGPASPDAKARLQVNMEVAQAIGVKGTPTFVWRKTDGTEGRIDGLPTSVPDLLASVGS
jgi:thiol:disulfide interchange protein DsbG